jgi:hypothetical protein
VASQGGLARFPRDRAERPGPISLRIGPHAFAYGIVFAPSTLAHEGTHVAIDLQALELRKRWRRSGATGTFAGWLERRGGRLSALDRELVSERLGTPSRPLTG